MLTIQWSRPQVPPALQYYTRGSKPVLGISQPFKYLLKVLSGSFSGYLLLSTILILIKWKQEDSWFVAVLE